jgi:hypothetical protein
MHSPLGLLALALLAVATTVFNAPVEVVGAPPPPHGPPVITSVVISSRDIRAGQTVSGRVDTSDNVGYVEARIDYRNLPLHRDGPGKFSGSYTVPWWLPFWLRHEWTLQIIARSVDGIETKEQMPIRIR